MKIYTYQSNKKPTISVLLSAFIILISIIILVYFFPSVSLSLTSQAQDIIVPISVETNNTITSKKAEITPTIFSSKLHEIIQAELSDTKGTYSIAIKHLATGETYYHNEHEEYLTGSLYKLWIMAAVYQAVQEQVLSEEEYLSQSIAVLNRKFQIDPEYAEQTEGTISRSIEEAISQMITISHNYAAMLLTEKITIKTTSELLEKYALNESKMGTSNSLPVTTASDIALFYEKLYEGTIIDTTYSNKMLKILKEQQLNQKVPKYLPDNLVIAHKTGELDGYSHDAGIVYSPNGDYIIVILTNTSLPSEANEHIASISQQVYEYFEKQ